jgi:ribosome-binding factor A
MIVPPKSFKHAQKEATLLKLVSQLLLEASLDNPELRALAVTRAKLSPDGSLCTLYFYTADGKQQYESIEPTLKLYKPSLRKAIAKKAALRHTPDFRFHFDEHIEKQQHMEEVFKHIKKDIS